jgi:hypothetical protein
MVAREEYILSEKRLARARKWFELHFVKRSLVQKKQKHELELDSLSTSNAPRKTSPLLEY